MDIISSRQNPLIKQIRRLSDQRRERIEQQSIVLDGIHLIQACLTSGRSLLRLVIAESALDHPEVRSIRVNAEAAPVTIVTDSVFHEISDLKTPTGILGLTGLPEGVAEKAGACVALEEVQDPGNVGSILRSAAAAGIPNILLSKGCADPWSPRVLRAGMGAHFSLNIICDADLPTLALAHQGPVISTSLAESTLLYECDLRGDIMLVMGNEGSGVSTELLQLSQKRVRIPMPGQAESLNVAAAAAVCLFERVRQQQH